MNPQFYTFSMLNTLTFLWILLNQIIAATCSIHPTLLPFLHLNFLFLLILGPPFTPPTVTIMVTYASLIPFLLDISNQSTQRPNSRSSTDRFKVEFLTLSKRSTSMAIGHNSLRISLLSSNYKSRDHASFHTYDLT